MPIGRERFALNLITQTEVQNAVTSLQVQLRLSDSNPNCVLVGESKQVIGYYLTDGQKLEKMEQQVGFGYIIQMTRFQDFMMITDAYFNSRLWVFRNKGHRLSALVEVDRAISAVHSEFLVNSFDDAQLYVV